MGSWKAREIRHGVETLIRGWLNGLRRNPKRTHLDWTYWNTFYWNERDYQWALFNHMRKNAEGSAYFGSEWWVHAEGTWSRPKWARKGRWKARKRSDIVVVNHGLLLEAVRNEDGDPRSIPLEAAIELKLTWDGGKATKGLIEHDLEKLGDIVGDGQARAGYLVWLEGVRQNGPRKGFPYFSPEQIATMRRGVRGVRVFHWPEPARPLIWTGDDASLREGIRQAHIGVYPRP